MLQGFFFVSKSEPNSEVLERFAVSLLFPRSQTSFFFGDMAFSWESLGDQKSFPKYRAMSWQLLCVPFFF